MPAPLIHVGATVRCAHGGAAAPTVPNPRVLVSGQPTVLMAGPYMISGCPFTVSGAPMPCITGRWVVAAQRVMSGGQPLVLMDSQAVCQPNGTPLVVVDVQMRAIGS